MKKLIAGALVLTLAIACFAAGIKSFQELEIRFGKGAGIRKLLFDYSPDGNTASIDVDSTTDNFVFSRPIENSEIRTPTRLDVKQDTEANLITYASTASDGQMVFATDTQKMYQIIGNSLEAVGGGGAGDVENIIVSPDFADETDPFTHTVGSGVVTVSGGHLDDASFPSPYISLETGTTHDHTWCFTPQVNRQYEVGCFVESTLDDIDVCFNDGTVDDTCNSSYDGSSKWKYVFQRGTPGTGDDVCLRITSPSSADIKVDSCRIGEPKFSTAELSNTSNLASYNPTFTGFGTTTAENMFYARDGQYLILERRFVSGVPASSPTAKVSLPVVGGVQLVIDSSVAVKKPVGEGGRSVSTSNTSKTWNVLGFAGDSFVEFAQAFYASGQAPDNPLAADALVVNGNGVFFKARIPIEGWTAKSTNVLTAVDNDQPEKRAGLSPGSIPNNTQTFIDFGASGSEVFNPDENFSGCNSGHVTTTNTGCKWTAPRSGKALVCSGLQLNGTADWDETDLHALDIFKNGSAYVRLDIDVKQATITLNHAAFSRGCAIVEVSKNDYLEMGFLQTSGNPRLPAGTNFEGTWEVSYVDAKALLAGLEDIGVKPIRYRHGTAQTITSGGAAQIINFETLDFDKEGLVTTGASWAYTVPKAGYYQVCAHAGLDPSAANYESELMIHKNTVFNSFLEAKTVKEIDTENDRVNLNGCDLVEAVAGDTFDVRIYQNSGGNLALSNANRNFISITRHEATLSTGADFVEKFQTKFLTADVNDTNNPITDLGTTALEIGKCYSYSMHGLPAIVTADNDSRVGVIINGVTHTNFLVWDDSQSDDGEVGTRYSEFHFIATSSTITVNLNSFTAGSVLRGGGTVDETYAQIREKNCVETSQW